MKKLNLACKRHFSTIAFMTAVLIVTWTTSHAQENQAVASLQSFDGDGTREAVLGCFKLTRNNASFLMNTPEFGGLFLLGDKVTYLKTESKCASASITIQRFANNSQLHVGNTTKGKDWVEFVDFGNDKASSSQGFVGLISLVWKELSGSGQHPDPTSTKGTTCDLERNPQYLSEGWKAIYIPVDEKKCPGFKPADAYKKKAQIIEMECNYKRTTGSPQSMSVSSVAESDGGRKWVVLSFDEGSFRMDKDKCYRLDVPSSGGDDNKPIQIKIEVVAVNAIQSPAGLDLEFNQRLAVLSKVGKKVSK